MGKFIRSFVFLFFVYILSNTAVFAKNNIEISGHENLATAPPSVYSPVTYWQNCSKPLMAIPSGGGTLNWYLTNLPTEFPTSTAPIPITTIIGSTTTYYVSQTIAGVESTRTPIVVKVEANSGATILNYRCDRSQIPDYSLDYTPPATINNSVLFDWANNNAFISQTYFCTYSVQGGASVTSFNPNRESHFIVSNLLPGQSVELTLTSASHPCVPSQTITCSVPCGASSTTVTFASVPISYCINEATTNLPTSSDDSPAITGTWSPDEKVKTATAGTTNYVFTPDPVLFPCALTRKLAITVGPVEPSFTDFSICSGVLPVPVLSPTSPNGISGDWSPSSVDNTTTKDYLFTPFPGQACSPTAKTINVTVNPSNTILSMGWTVSEAFADNQIVTVTDPLGANYLYQLDDGPFQEETVFEMVSLGMHSITVKDVNGCSVLRNDNVLVIDYPRFFTPNNDGFNDYWNVFTLVDKFGSKIQIFDRYGKLIKEISPNGTGWNGTYNGRPLPATDYWFVVDYPEDGIIKKYRSHFSLKR
jgi:gliding motility-associated-like protein